MTAVTFAMFDRERLDRALAVLDDLPDDELIEAAAAVADDIAYLRDIAKAFDAAVLRRLNVKNATVLPSARVVAELEPGSRKYVWDPKALSREFRPHLAPAMWDECVTIEPPKPAEPVITVNTRKVLSTAKRLGVAAEEALAKCYTLDEGAPRLRYKPVAEEDQPL